MKSYKYDGLDRRECESLIADKCTRLKKYPRNPFKSEEEILPRLQLAQEIIALLHQKYKTEAA